MVFSVCLRYVPFAACFVGEGITGFHCMAPMRSETAFVYCAYEELLLHEAGE